MRVLIAEDDATSRKILSVLLGKWGWEITVATNGREAWEVLRQDDAPRLAILDWMMPEADGIDVCRRVRKIKTDNPTYIILLTALASKERIVEGLDAGAHDYVTKPFNRAELRARIDVGWRVVQLQTALHQRAEELQRALEHVQTLQGILPICMHCKRIRDDGDAWQMMEEYVEGHSDAQFSHSLCPACEASYSAG